jgi:hypothetical protein
VTAVERTRSCRCGARYGGAAFAALRPVRTLDASEIASLVVRWPDDVVVDVRACARCAAPIAALTRTSRIPAAASGP